MVNNSMESLHLSKPKGNQKEFIDPIKNPSNVNILENIDSK